MFKTLASLLVVHTHNVHIYHWKISGPAFQPDHEFLDSLYSTMNGHIDRITEIGLEYGENPVSLQTVLDTLNSATTKHILVDPNADYTAESTFKSVISIFTEIMDECNAIYAMDGLASYHKADIETIHSWYSKMAKYLLPRRFIAG